MYASFNICNVWVYIITSTQVVQNEKENIHTPHCNFLRRLSHNKLLQIFLWEKWGRGNFFWKHWEGRLMWKGKFTYTYTLLIIQCLCNNYSSTQKINETKVNNLRNKTHTCFLIPMMKGYELKVKHQVNSRVSLIKKGSKYWEHESLKKQNMLVCFPEYLQCLSVHNNFHTSGKKMRKKICILLVATLRRSSHE